MLPIVQCIQKLSLDVDFKKSVPASNICISVCHGLPTSVPPIWWPSGVDCSTVRWFSESSCSGWWFGTWMDYDFPFSWEWKMSSHLTNSLHDFRAIYRAQPPSSVSWMEESIQRPLVTPVGSGVFPKNWMGMASLFSRRRFSKSGISQYPHDMRRNCSKKSPGDLPILFKIQNLGWVVQSCLIHFSPLCFLE